MDDRRKGCVRDKGSSVTGLTFNSNGPRSRLPHGDRHTNVLSIIVPQAGPHSASGPLPRGLGAIHIYCRLTSLRYTFYHPKPSTMAAGVLMNNSPTPHRSRNISQATPNTGASTTGVQPNKPTPDDVVDRLLERAKSPMGEAEVWKVVETLEKVSSMHLLPPCRYAKPADDRCYSHNSN